MCGMRLSFCIVCALLLPECESIIPMTWGSTSPAAILCIGFSSSAAISLFDKVIKTNEKSLSEIGKDFGKATADISANAYQGFVETWDKTVKEKESE